MDKPLKNLKPSQFPEHTLIDVVDLGIFLKSSHGIWNEVYFGSPESTGRVSDAGCENLYIQNILGLTTSKKADDLFTNFKILALEPSFTISFKDLHGVWNWETGRYTDGSDIHNCKRYNCEY